MKAKSICQTFYLSVNSGLVLSFIQHRFTFLCSSHNGSVCSMRCQRSW